jgi:hypothetical protein
MSNKPPLSLPSTYATQHALDLSRQDDRVALAGRLSQRIMSGATRSLLAQGAETQSSRV